MWAQNLVQFSTFELFFFSFFCSFFHIWHIIGRPVILSDDHGYQMIIMMATFYNMYEKPDGQSDNNNNNNNKTITRINDDDGGGWYFTEILINIMMKFPVVFLIGFISFFLSSHSKHTHHNFINKHWSAFLRLLLATKKN